MRKNKDQKTATTDIFYEMKFKYVNILSYVDQKYKQCIKNLRNTKLIYTGRLKCVLILAQ